MSINCLQIIARMVAHKVAVVATKPFSHTRAICLELPDDMLFMSFSHLFFFIRACLLSTFDILIVSFPLQSHQWPILSKTPTIKAWQIEFSCFYQNRRINAVIVCKLNSKWEIDWMIKKRTPFIGGSVSNTCCHVKLLCFFFSFYKSIISIWTVETNKFPKS